MEPMNAKDLKESQHRGWRQAIMLLTAYTIDAHEHGDGTWEHAFSAIEDLANEIILEAGAKGGFEAAAHAFRNYSMALATIAIAAHAQHGEGFDEVLVRLQHLAQSGNSDI